MTNAPAGAQEGRAAESTVALSGCITTAPGSSGWVLGNVTREPRGGVDPHTNSAPAGGPHAGITEGAYVRLDAGDRDLKAQAGQRVRITGSIVDTGANTIGTPGAAGSPNAAGDTSQAAAGGHHSDKVKQEAGRIARESMADGTAALVRIQTIESTGERCQTELRPESRQ